MRRVALILLLALFTLQLLAAEDDAALQTRLNASLKGKIVALRGFYHGNKLQYGASGDLIGKRNAGIWPVDGYIEIESISVKRQEMKIDGYRQFATINVPEDLHLPKDALEDCKSLPKPQFEYHRSDRVLIRIARPPGGDEKQIDQMLMRVFYRRGEDFTPDVPAMWRKLFQNARMSSAEFSEKEAAACEKRKPKANSSIFADAISSVTETVPDGKLANGEPVYSAGRAGGSVKPPKAIRTPDPGYTEVARARRREGTCLFQVVVDSTGAISTVEVVRPCGFGLDENASQAILTWKFQPATLKEKPVASMVQVEVSFHLY